MLIESPKSESVATELFFEKVKKLGGRALFVGGCVRDALRGETPKDFDVEV